MLFSDQCSVLMSQQSQGVGSGHYANGHPLAVTSFNVPRGCVYKAEVKVEY